MIGSCVATPPRNKMSISNVARNGDCQMWNGRTIKKPTVVNEWNSCKKCQGDILDNEFKIDTTCQHNKT